MKRIILLMILLVLAVPTLAQDADSVIDVEQIECPDGEASLVVAAGSVGDELEATQELFRLFMEACPDVEVSALESPALATDRLGLYIQFLGTRSAAVDVYQIDVTWPTILAEHMVDLYEYAPADSETIEQHFPAIINNNTVDSELVGMPWFTDAGLLYYRTDLLDKYDLTLPTTWAELEDAAREIQRGERDEGNDDFWGYVWQGTLGEATTINALEWQASSGGGSIVSPEGEIQVNNREAIDAIERAAGWIGDISPDEVIGHAPEDSRSIWQAGDAAFMRNWPYAYNLGNQSDSDIAGSFAVAPLPAGDNGSRTGTLGGWQLGVSQYSENPDAAAALVLFLTSPQAQKYRTLELGLAPTVQSLYDDEEVLEAVPFLTSLSEVLENATARPSTVAGTRYNNVSQLYYNAVHSVLRGEEDARTAMEDLEFDLEDLFATELEIEPTVVAQADDTPEDDATEEATTATEEAADATEEVATETEDDTATTDEGSTETTEDSTDNTTLIIVIVVAAIVVIIGGFFFLRGSNNPQA